tara:strand:+ start:2895 stop:3149 length:255 start_codon:yes stop_codon:yes gene_type:complete
MSFKMRGTPFKRNFDFSKKNDYSPEKTKNTIGAKFARSIIPDISTDNSAWENIKGAVSAFAPIGKAAKFVKTAYNYFSGDEPKA